MTQLRIGELARLGGASVRMLRHYHEIGLLEPAAIDPATGYRTYSLDQLSQLREIVGLRALGLALDDIAQVVDGHASVAAEVLRKRRAELVAEAASASRAVASIDRLLAGHPTEKGSTMTAEPLTIEIKSLPARLVAQLTDVSPDWSPQNIGPTIRPLYPELMHRMEAAGMEIAGPSTAWYEDSVDGGVLVHATLAIAERPAGEVDFEVIELPAVEAAACAIHRGTMDDCERTYERLLRWIAEHGHQSAAHSREVDIECGPDQEWITELQIELRSGD